MTAPLRLSIGTAPIGGLFSRVDPDVASATLRRATELGVDHFDTAPLYGHGEAERRLGEYLATREFRDHVGPDAVVSTKVGRLVRPVDERSPDDIFLGAPPGTAEFDFSASGVERSLVASRRRLGGAAIDVALLHDPEAHLDQALGDGLSTLVRLREAGEIGAIGVGTNVADTARRFLETGSVDVILLAGAITLLDASGETVAAGCAEAGVDLWAGGVFQSGVLADPSRGSFHYGPVPESVARRVATLHEICRSHDVSLLHAALAHPLRFAGVTRAVVGVRTPREVEQAVHAAATTIDDAVWADLDASRSNE